MEIGWTWIAPRWQRTAVNTEAKHMINADGSARDSVYFSVVDDQWPAVRTRLQRMLLDAPRA